mmetsp:Transcript_49146/g.100316  ORF Transcript_49146/g.100316 Transcript_49146/m.100316 type:complete len:185 (-) Transcript_49146:200-754(-)|eukprot:CAMPEP_0181298522 /NCGR_PEP_ID=MMETSP1101-20121128/5829_1 /TAXON_ID=46948 /ORGANISM="Rhodomonas abbreviata, Strain Caron Lab Isolate" /LENGTH=184 /DNA_ID=CAMNT_0023403553 /DNA_START=48 /DNA_END=602 /DNA_ORIENTATION=+
MGAKYESIQVGGDLPREVFIVNVEASRRKRSEYVRSALALAMAGVVACAVIASSSHTSEDELVPTAASSSAVYTPQMLAEDEAKAKDGGAVCLEKEGLTKDEVKKFGDGTVCLGWKIKKNLGLGDTVHMVRDYLEAPMNQKDLCTCLHGIDEKIQKAVHKCLSALPPAAAKSPVVEFWRKNTVA